MQYQTMPDVLAEHVDGRVLLISADSSELLTLNPVGSVVWTALAQGSATLDAIVAAVCAVYTDAPAPKVAEDVASFLEELVAAGLARAS